MKRKLALLLSGIAILLFALPLMAQDAAPTEEPLATEEAGEVIQYDPEVCFAAAESNDTMVQFEAKEGPYLIAVSNSFIGNAWRTQMAQAFVETEDAALLVDDLLIVSTGDDVEAQIAAMDNMISLGVDAIILNAINPTSFDAVVSRAADAGIIVVAFDGIVDAPEAILVNEDQIELHHSSAY